MADRTARRFLKYAAAITTVAGLALGIQSPSMADARTQHASAITTHQSDARSAAYQLWGHRPHRPQGYSIYGHPNYRHSWHYGRHNLPGLRHHGYRQHGGHFR
ncbi:hypothetical protein J5X84_28390 [Streptosporangiaceae bacterium NEAU-GS5]|nr:hypothetical protein [Streptosporangiaceae bacterium NEAU-GS5]